MRRDATPSRCFAISPRRATLVDAFEMTEAMNGCVAVFDIGKTNMKVVVFDAAGKVVA